MPTAAKLVAAIAFALVGAVAARGYVPLMPEHAAPGLLVPACALIGALAGWFVVGPRAGALWRFAPSNGLSGAIVLAAAVLVLFSTYEMLSRALDKRYSGPEEALQGVFGIAWDHMTTMADIRVLGPLIIGGVLGGVVTEWAGRRWP